VVQGVSGKYFSCTCDMISSAKMASDVEDQVHSPHPLSCESALAFSPNPNPVYCAVQCSGGWLTRLAYVSCCRMADHRQPRRRRRAPQERLWKISAEMINQKLGEQVLPMA
jgi:hypothetical protein